MHPLGFVVSLLLQRTACCGANVFVAAHRLDPTQDLKFSATENNPASCQRKSGWWESLLFAESQASKKTVLSEREENRGMHFRCRLGLVARETRDSGNTVFGRS